MYINLYCSLNKLSLLSLEFSGNSFVCQLFQYLIIMFTWRRKGPYIYIQDLVWYDVKYKEGNIIFSMS